MDTVSSSEVLVGAHDQNADAQTSLMHLPPEISWDIASRINLHDLASIVRVCKRAYEIYIPRLYETIKLSPTNLQSPNISAFLISGSVNFKHVRAVQVVGRMEEPVGPLDDSVAWKSRSTESLSTSSSLNKFLNRLGEGTIREFVYAFGEKHNRQAFKMPRGFDSSPKVKSLES
ncbi:hypothetical protein TWF718_010492 [Orbilia javanica]|uniref:F-box domain-containing protein n=1 Tax=Orbilia javanica TaxID=47235 RepID=A0AAN8MSH9_9PEZI